MSICPCAKSCLGSAYWPFNCSIMKRSLRINLALLVGYGWIRVLACGGKNKKKTTLHIFLWGSEGRPVAKLNFYLPTCRDTPLAYHRTTNSQVHYYPPLSSTSSSQSRMYLIILLSVTLWRLFGGCYLFAVETPQGSVQPIRDCCSVNNPLTSSGWAWLLFKWVSFVLAWSSSLRLTDSPGESLMALLYALHHAGWSHWSCQGQRGLVVVVGGDCLWLQKSKEWVRINSWKRCTAVACSNIRKWGWLCEWPLYAPELCGTGIIRYPRCVFHFFPLLSAAIFVFKQGANLQCKNLMWVKCINCCSRDGLVKGSVTDDSYISCTFLV